MKPSPSDEHLLLVDSFGHPNFSSSSFPSSLSSSPLPSSQSLLVDESNSLYNDGYGVKEEEETVMEDVLMLLVINPLIAAVNADIDPEILIRLLPLDTNFTSFVEVLIVAIDYRLSLRRINVNVDWIHQNEVDFELHVEAQVQSGRLVLVKYPLKRAIHQWNGGSLTDVRVGLLSLVSHLLTDSIITTTKFNYTITHI